MPPKPSSSWTTKVLNHAKTTFELFVRFVGPLFVILATILISAVIVVHFRAIIPYYTDYDTLSGLIHLTVSSFISYNIGFNYFKTIFTPPGSTFEHSELNVPQEELERLKRESAPRKGEGFSRFCKVCKKYKPERAHHCHVCKQCVLKMDHHCPWVNNCVGFNNHKYFVLFLLYLWMGCGYVAIMSFIPFRHSSDFKVPWKGWSSRGTIIFTFVITLAVCLALGFMLIWHLYLALSGQTTIEFYYNRYMIKQASSRGISWENPYDLGYRKNFQLFFGVGKYWFSWLLPSSAPLPGNGISYLTRSQHKNSQDV